MWLKRSIRRIRRKARRGELAPDEFGVHLHYLGQYHEKAREGYIAYLNSSGERLGDLLSMDTDTLRKWFGVVRARHEQEQERLRQRQQLLGLQRSQRR